MSWKVIKTESGYRKTVKRAMVIFQSKKGTTEAEELALLLTIIKAYEDENVQILEALS